MSDKWKLYGVITSSGGTMIGLNGEDLPVWWVDVGLSNDRWVGFSVKGDTLNVGDVVSVVECGETRDTWGQLWGLIPYANGNHSVVGVMTDAQKSAFGWAYPATSAMNWLCRHAGAAGRIYWPGTVTAVSGSTLTVQDRWGTYTRELPVSSDLSTDSFSAGDTVLVYDQGTTAEVIGWWMMQPARGFWTGTFTFVGYDTTPVYSGLAIKLHNADQTTIISPSLANTNFAFYPTEILISPAYFYSFGFTHPALISFGLLPPSFTLKISKPIGGWDDDMWPIYGVWDRLMNPQIYTASVNKSDGSFSNI